MRSILCMIYKGNDLSIILELFSSSINWWVSSIVFCNSTQWILSSMRFLSQSVMGRYRALCRVCDGLLLRCLLLLWWVVAKMSATSVVEGAAQDRGMRPHFHAYTLHLLLDRVSQNTCYYMTIISCLYQLIIQICQLVTNHAIYFSFDTISVTVSDDPSVISVTFVTLKRLC
jgi:hypothetical protein